MIVSTVTGKNWTTVAIYVALGIFALVQVLQARKLREDQARPFLIVDFDPGSLIYLTVANIGRTMARDVRIKFDEKLESTLQRPRELDESPIFRESIPALPPGKEIRVLFDSAPDGLNSDLPLTYEGTIKYRGDTARKPYEERCKLDLGIYLGAAPPPPGIPELVTEMERIRKEIQKWGGSLSVGLLVDTPQRQERLGRRRFNAYILRTQGMGALARHLWKRATLKRR